MFGLSDCEEIMTLAFFVLIQYRSVTDGRTDGHLCSGYTSACIACYANALVKSICRSTNLLQVGSLNCKFCRKLYFMPNQAYFCLVVKVGEVILNHGRAITTYKCKIFDHNTSCRLFTWAAKLTSDHSVPITGTA